MTIKHALTILVFLILNIGYGQDIYERNESIDVLHYTFSLELNDINNQIEGESVVKISFKQKVDQFALDLIGKTGKYGMTILGVYENDKAVNYQFSDDKIIISPSVIGEGIRFYKIQYQGMPEKGLVIDTTKFGQRSFFGDNWPNLARHWLPCILLVMSMDAQMLLRLCLVSLATPLSWVFPCLVFCS